MHLSSIFKEYGVDINKTKILRHPLSKTDVAEIYAKGMIEAYQSTQTKTSFKDCEYIASFVGSEMGSEATFIGVYRVVSFFSGAQVAKQMPAGYPYPNHFDDTHTYYELEKLDIMNDLENKLIVYWPNARSWAQWAKHDKEVLSIASREEISFPGYEAVILKYSQLGDVISNPRYRKWNEALSNINAIYLICDSMNGKQYIGSTYGKQGLLGRWSEYYKSKDGGDAKIKEHLKSYPDAFLNFQFTILRVLQKPITINEAVEIENLYKDKLLTRESVYGLNMN
ncbi:GIY-YIG nuclease family protein [Pseudobutyrivibrio ruminis]|uniref:GIY-YIG nuclease family protein n=1 Tax=Pseudobutyrivibrio ruminis TaxID=46206 RepID=UPI00041AE870|nr:GIY-YIG nuclease family protein [Pseudobutyrivibrio ruminis]